LDIERDRLPELAPDIRANIVKAAHAAGQVDALIVDQDIELAARSAAYHAESAAETDAERDRNVLFAAFVAQCTRFQR